MLDQQNRQAFLARLAEKMGRASRTEVVGHYPQVNHYPSTRLTELSEQELYQKFITTAEQTLVECVATTPQNAAQDLLQLCEKYQASKIILNDDQRLVDYGLTEAISQQYQHHIWSTQTSQQNREFATNADIGIVFAEYGLTESGGIVLFSNPHYGRSVSLLPKISIVVLKRSTILPRVAQLSEILHQKAQQGERMPSCINLISGPSSTADIELVKVVGVHGPIKCAYLIIDDKYTA